MLLDRSAAWLPWLRIVVLGGGPLAAVALMPMLAPLLHHSPPGLTLLPGVPSVLIVR